MKDQVRNTSYLSCFKAYSSIFILLTRSFFRFSWPFLSPCRNAILAWRHRETQWWEGVGKNIDSSVHCNIFFPNSISIHKILWIDSGHWPPAVPRRTSRSLAGPLGLSPPAAGKSRPRPLSRVGGWCAAETPSELRRRVADVWRTISFRDCKLPAAGLTLAAAPCARG